ncbi:MAG: ATP-binding cassette domain-containing protein [Candidatus Eisenbacteria bacterium]|nr:ATP-binding cassette domain-containing protein [Candidatus Eisenbacteria bacterium]
MSDVLVLSGVSKSFGDLVAVSSLDLSVARGSVFGLLGPNGAGKTTTIRMIMDIIRPDAGTIHLLGDADAEARRARTSYLPEERGLYRKMKARELLLYFARLRNVPPAEARARADRWLARFELSNFAESKLEALSKGMGQKVQFIAAILHQPELIILDEPFSGLDPVNVELVKSVMLELRDAGTTLIFSTHQMDTVEKLCDSICLINKGRKMLDGPIGQIRRQHGTNTVRLEYTGEGRFIKDPALVAKSDDSGRFVELVPAPGVTPQQVLAAAVREVEVHRFEIAEPSLHQIFIETVRARGEEVAA